MANPLTWCFQLVNSCMTVPAFSSLLVSLSCLAFVVVAWRVVWGLIHV